MDNFAYTVPCQASARILVVEDDRDIAGMLIELMKEAGYVAEAVGSAIEMDRQLKKKDFNLIVLDGCSQAKMASAFAGGSDRLKRRPF